MESTPPLEHAALFSPGGLRQRVHKTPVGPHDHEDRVGPICEQKDGYEQPTPIERALAAVPRNFGRRTTIVTQFPNPEIFP